MEIKIASMKDNENSELNKYVKRLEKMFNLKIELKINIFDSKNAFVKSLELNKLIESNQIKNNVFGKTKSDEIYILSKEYIENNSKHKFIEILKHEIAHVFIHKSFGRGPSWFDEGLACLIAGQNKFNSSLDVNPCKLITKFQFDEDKLAYEKSKKLVNDLIKGVMNEIGRNETN